MPSPFTTIEDLIRQVLSDVLDPTDTNAKLDKILANQETLKLGVLSIQEFLGIGDAQIISPADIALLQAKLQQDTVEAKQLSDLATEVGTINTNPPEKE